MRDTVAAMVSHEDVQKLAALARIEVPEDRLATFATEFDAILAYVGKLEELEISLETPHAGAVRNVLRPDENPHEAGVWTEKITEQFPSRKGNHLEVKQIISYD